MDYEFEKDHSYLSSPLFKMDNEIEKENEHNLFFNDSSDDFHSNFKLAFNNDSLYNEKLAYNYNIFKNNNEIKTTPTALTIFDTHHNTPLIIK